jgi:hypothetical protein
MDRIEMLLSLMLRSQDELLFREYMTMVAKKRDRDIPDRRVDTSNQRVMYERVQKEKE